MWVAFAVQKLATHIFSAKNIRILYIESAKTVNEMTLNELVKLTTLWTTGPRYINGVGFKVLARTRTKIIPKLPPLPPSHPPPPIPTSITVFRLYDMWCFTDKVENPYADQTYICKWETVVS